MRLNRIQRGLLIGAAVIIALFMYLDGYSARIEESIAGVLLILLLLLAAFGFQGKQEAEVKVEKHSASQFQFAFSEARSFLDSRLEGARKAFTGDTLPSEPSAVKFAYMLVFLAREKADRTFGNSDQAKALKMKAVSDFVHHVSMDIKIATGSDSSRQNAIVYAAKEFLKCDTAVRDAIMCFTRGEAHPLDPIFREIERDLPLAQGGAAEREALYGPLARRIATATLA